MYCLLGLLFCFLNTCLLGVDRIFDEGCKGVFDKTPSFEQSIQNEPCDAWGDAPQTMLYRPGTFAVAILRKLKSCQPASCHYDDLYALHPKPSTHYENLYALHPKPSNKARDLTIAILELRNNGWNVHNNSLTKRCALLEGKRDCRTECYQEGLWRWLGQEDELLKKPDATVAQELSDAGYFVDFWGVCALKLLWPLMFKRDCSRKNFESHKKAWNVILQDFHVYGQFYYSVHPLVQTDFSSRDIASFNKMFTFYKDSVEPQDHVVGNVCAQLPYYLKMLPEGVTLQDIQEFLNTNGSEGVGCWRGIGMLVRSGYGVHIRYENGRVCWNAVPEREPPVVTQRDLLVNIANLFRENPCCEYITFALYKRKFFAATPFDVNNILDVLIAAECVHPSSTYAFGGVILGQYSDPSYLQELRKNCMLSKIKKGAPVLILNHLKVRVYPKHFRWSAQELSAPKNTKRTHNQKFSAQQVASKKPCLEAEDAVERTQTGLSEEGRTDDEPFDNLCCRGALHERLHPDALSLPPPMMGASDDAFSNFDVELPDFNEPFYHLCCRDALHERFHPDALSLPPPMMSASGDESINLDVGLPALSAMMSNCGEPSVFLESQSPHLDGLQYSVSPDPLALLGAPYNCSEENAEKEEPLGEIAQCMQERQQALLEHLKSKENTFCSFEELQFLYGEGAKKVMLFEDALSLMHSHQNVEYNTENGQCRLRAGPVDQAPKRPVEQTMTSCVHFFCQKLQNPSFNCLDVCEKTLVLYEHGYRFVPLSTVALFETIGRSPRSTAQWSQREQRIEALKDKILKEEVLKCAYEYKGLFPKGGGKANDLTRIRKSMKLYTLGNSILQKKLQKNSGVKGSKRKKVGAVTHPEILDFLRAHKGQPCFEGSLKEVACTDDSHNSRDMYRTIVELRMLSHNIIHEGDYFTLLDGKREAKNGLYKKVLWKTLEKPGALFQKHREILLYISDLGYNPAWNVIENMVMLKKLCKKDRRLPDHRLAIWDLIMKEGELREESHYQALFSETTVGDMRILSSCWALYNHIMYNQDPVLAQATKTILESRPEGLSLKKLTQILSKEMHSCKGKHLNAWNVISGLMRCGYAGEMSVTGETVTWRKGAPKIVPTTKTLYQDLRNIPLDCAAGEATILLHKQGHFNVSPWDVEQLLDIFAFLGYREDGRCQALQTIWQDRLYRTDIAYRDAVLIKRIQWLQSTGFLNIMQQGLPINLEEILETEEWLSIGEGTGIDHKYY